MRKKNQFRICSLHPYIFLKFSNFQIKILFVCSSIQKRKKAKIPKPGKKCSICNCITQFAAPFILYTKLALSQSEVTIFFFRLFRYILTTKGQMEIEFQKELFYFSSQAFNLLDSFQEKVYKYLSFLSQSLNFDA